MLEGERAPMFLVRYSDAAGPRIGIALDRGVLPTDHRDLGALISAGPSELELLRSAVEEADASGLLRDPQLLAPLPHSAQLLFAGANYRSHLAETGLEPKEPLFFAKLRSSVVGPGSPIVIPSPETQTDWEAELAVVIGQTAHRIRAEDAMGYVFGYTLVNDVSARDVMSRDRMQITLSKSPDTFGPLGPHIVTADSIPDPTTTPLELTTKVNGVLKQQAVTTDMIFAIPELLEFLSRTMTLQPGDIVSTGTAGGTGMGRTPQEFLRPGDEVTVSVTELGELTNPVLAGWDADRSDA